MNNEYNQKEEWGRTWKELGKVNDYRDLSLYYQEWHAQLVKTLSQHIEFSRHKTMLECGCGNGIFTYEIANVFPHLKLFLSDISPEAIVYSKKLLEKCKIERISKNFNCIVPDYAVESMFQLEREDKSMDLIINGGTLEHYSDEDILCIIKELLRVLKDQGVLIIVVPNVKNFDFKRKNFQLWLRKISRKRIFGRAVLYGGNDERNITYQKFKNILNPIEKNINIKFVKHPVAFPRFFPRYDNKFFCFFEKMLVNIGFNWANIFIIRKQIKLK